MRHSALVALASALCLGLAGCAAITGMFPVPNAGWKTRTGQLAYEGKARSLVGDIVLQTAPNGDIKLDFLKGPGPSLISIRQSSDRARVEGALARLAWQGIPEDAPTPLRGWLRIQPVVAALESGAALPKGVQADLQKAENGAWKRLTIVIPRRREKFQFVFQH